jgi:hypothetical protein
LFHTQQTAIASISLTIKEEQEPLNETKGKLKASKSLMNGVLTLLDLPDELHLSSRMFP